MKGIRKQFSILSSAGFILGLILLLLNDWLLKDLFHNWATGKLSDFAGMFVFPLFWVALFPRLAKHAFWASALWFIYWKSPYSQWMIDGWNQIGLYSIHRVVDLTDLLALIMVPLAYRYWKIEPNMSRFKLNPILPLGIAAFAFMATSYNNVVHPKKMYVIPIPKDSFNAWLPLQDSITMLTKLDADNPDTATFWLAAPKKEDDFNRQYEMNITTAGLSNNKTLISLNVIYGGSEPEDSILKYGVYHFEKTVIAPFENHPKNITDSLPNIP